LEVRAYVVEPDAAGVGTPRGVVARLVVVVVVVFVVTDREVVSCSLRAEVDARVKGRQVDGDGVFPRERSCSADVENAVGAVIPP